MQYCIRERMNTVNRSATVEVAIGTTALITSLFKPKSLHYATPVHLVGIFVTDMHMQNMFLRRLFGKLAIQAVELIDLQC